jgi:DNA polymerase-3 subunit beta
MKFSCTKDNLFRGLSSTAHLVGRNINLPILNNVLIKADRSGIKLTTTNLEIAVVCFVRGKVEEEGEFTVPSKLLFDYINLLPNEKIDIESDGEKLSISCEKNKTEINGLSANEFPLVPPITGDNVFEFDAQETRRALSQVLFAVASNESRVELSGVLFSFKKEGAVSSLLIAATDSYRLAEKEIVMDVPITGEPQTMIIPARTLAEVSRILSLFKDDVDAERRLQVRTNESQVVFKNGAVEITSRVIEGSYPDYKQIVPQDFRTKAVVNKEEMMKAVKTASLFSRTGLFDVTIAVDSTSGITIMSNNTGRGQNTAHCEAVVVGDPNTVTVNYRYLLDGLQAMEENEVEFGINDGSSPCLIRPKQTKNYFCLVMPIKQ